MKWSHIYLFLTAVSICNYQIEAAGVPRIDGYKRGELRTELTRLILQGGKTEEIRKIADKIDFNSWDRDGRTGLYYILFHHGREQVLKFLLDATHVNFNMQDIQGRTALIWAVGENMEEAVKILLQRPDLNVNLKDENGDTALHRAIFFGYDNIVKLLLKAPDVDINAQNKRGQTALLSAVGVCHTSVTSDRKINIIKLLLEVPGINVNLPNNEGTTALMETSRRSAFNAAELLLEMPGIKINSYNKDGATAYSLTNWQWSKFVLRKKIDSLMQKGFRAISAAAKASTDAARNNEIETLRSVIDQIGVDEVDSEFTDKAITEHFLRGNPDGLETNAQLVGNTFLHKAFEFNRIGIATELLRISHDPQSLLTARNKKGQIPLELVSPTSEIFNLCMDLAFAQASSQLDNPADTDEIESAPQLRTDSVSTNTTEQLLTEKSCANCAKKSCINLCGRCKKVYYCSADCQKAHWNVHKRCCKAA